MAQNIYELHDKAFFQVDAYVVTRRGKFVATVAIKYPPRGHAERRVWAYVHLLGEHMVRAWADGYGYDKTSAALQAAIQKIKEPKDSADSPDWRSLQAAATEMDAGSWETRLRAHGFEVLKAV